MSSTWWIQDPLDPVREIARELELCPVSLVDEFTSEHWDAFEICSWFECEKCVATPEDFGFSEGTDDDEGLPEAGRGIPF